MSTVILVHGAWGGAWVYDEVVHGLQLVGHLASAIDLPGHGNDSTPIAEVSMQAYVDRVSQEVASAEGPVVLGGHSLAGSVISQVAERMPEKIASLVYIAALLPQHGQSPLELMKSDEGGWLLPRMTFSEDGTYTTVSEDVVREVFLHDMTDARRVDEMVPRFDTKQATQPFSDPAQLTHERFGTVRKAYIRCERDRVISTTLQDKMISSSPLDHVINLESGHFPFLSIVDRLVQSIDEIANPKFAPTP